MQKLALVFFGCTLGVFVTLFFVPEFSVPRHTIDVAPKMARQHTPVSSSTFRVTHVVDGDTIDVTDTAGVKQRVRFIGIDTPETVDQRKEVECGGQEASDRMHALLDGKIVMLHTKPDEDKDQYGRLLRYVFLGDEDIGSVMLSEGYAESLCDRYPHPKCALYDRLEAAAKGAGKGRWGGCAKS